MVTAGTIESATIHEVLIFSGEKESKEYEGRKHIGAEDLLREIARRRAANPAWNNEAAIGHRSFRNDVAGWWEEAVPSDNSPKTLRALTKNWEEFEVVFRRACIIKSISPHCIRQNNPKESEDEESEDDWSTEESEEEESEDEESEDDGSPKEGEDAESEDDCSPERSEHGKLIDERDGACWPEVDTQCVTEEKGKFRLSVPDLLPQHHRDWWLSDWDKNDNDRCQNQVWFDNWVEVSLELLKTVVGQDTRPLRAY
jgi:hypothetical protein